MPVARGTFNYILAPFQWGDDGAGTEEGWLPPIGWRSVVDLRPLAAQGRRGGAPEGSGFFALDPAADIPAKAQLLGDGLAVTLQGRRDAEERLGLDPGDLADATVLDAVWRALTVYADPPGSDGARPLMPTRAGNIELSLRGHSVVRRERFRWGVHPATERVAGVLQLAYEQARAEFSRSRRDHHRRMLDYWRAKYARCGLTDYRQLLPSRLRDSPADTPLRHGTTVTESFGTADATDLGPDQTWTEVVQTWKVIANSGDGEAAPSTVDGNSMARARCEGVVSGTDHRADLEIRVMNNTARFGPICRFAAAADTGYSYAYRGDPTAFNRDLIKRVAGTFTRLDSDDILDSLPVTYGVEADGSTINGYVDDVLENTATDTAIADGVRGGMEGGGTAQRADDYVIADLGGGGGDPGANADLADLQVSPGVLSPAFDPAVTSYTVNVANAADEIDITATLDDENATLEINGSPATSGVAETLPLNVGANVVQVEVTAEDAATVKTYTITVTRQAAPAAAAGIPRHRRSFF